MLAEVGPGYQTKSMDFKKGAKGAVVVAVVIRGSVHECVCAPVAHEFSIDFICKLVSSKVYQK